MSILYSVLGPNHYMVDPDVTDNHASATDSGSIQYIINLIDASGSGGIIELMPGRYNVTGSTPISFQAGNNNVTIRGCGYSSEIYKDQLAEPTNRLLGTSQANHIRFENFRITGDGANTADAAIYCFNSDHVVLDGLWSTGTKSNIVDFNACDHAQVINCKFKECERYPIYARNGSDFLSIMDNKIVQGTAGSGITERAFIYIHTCLYSIIARNHLINDDDFGMHGGIKLEYCQYFSIDSNMIMGLPTQGANLGYISLYYTTDGNIQTNIIYNNSIDHGIYMFGANYVNSKSNMITNMAGYGSILQDCNFTVTAQNLHNSNSLGNYTEISCSNCDHEDPS